MIPVCKRINPLDLVECPACEGRGWWANWDWFGPERVFCDLCEQHGEVPRALAESEKVATWSSVLGDETGRWVTEVFRHVCDFKTTVKVIDRHTKSQKSAVAESGVTLSDASSGVVATVERLKREIEEDFAFYAARRDQTL